MSIFQRLFRNRTKNVNLTICGLDKAGKTTILGYLFHGEFKETIPTHGLNREKITLPKLNIDVFDLGGQEEFRPIWSDYNEQSDGLIYVVDATDRERVGESKAIFHDLINTQINRSIPVLILLNKCDIFDKMPILEFIKEFSLNDPNLEINWAVFETSALTGEGLLNAMGWIINSFGGN